MEIISEPCPASWEDGGLNWDSPNPTDFRYFAAIREAILERSLAVDYKLNHTLLREIRPYHVLSADQLREVGEQIYSLSQRFLCAQAEDWKPILDCYPIYQQGEYPAPAGRISCRNSRRDAYRGRGKMVTVSQRETGSDAVFVFTLYCSVLL